MTSPRAISASRPRLAAFGMGGCGWSTAAIPSTLGHSIPKRRRPHRSRQRSPSMYFEEAVTARERASMPRRTTEPEEIPRVNSESDVTRHRRPEAKGVLVLIGGACTPHGHALRSFLDLAGARSGGRIIGLTTASAEPEESARHWLTTFRSAGAFNVEIPMFDRTDDTLDARIARMVRDASGVFLGGGDQVKLVAALSGTRTCAAIRELHDGGGVICGTSAGAAALTELTMS